MRANWAILLLLLFSCAAFAKDPDGLNFTLVSSSCASPVECSAVLRVCAVNKTFDASRLSVDFWNGTYASASASIIPLDYSWKNKADLKKGECGDFTLVARRPASVASQPSGKLAWGADWRIYYDAVAVHPEWAWWNSSWTSRQVYQFNSTSPTAINNFPMPVYIDTTNTSAFNTSVGANCTNIRMVNSSDNGTLFYEYISGCGTGNTTFRVGVNASAQTGNTSIYIYSGNLAPSATELSYQTGGTNATKVWTQFGAYGAFHLQETGATVIDSAGISNGTITGTATSVAAQFGNGRNLTGGSNYITLSLAHTMASANDSQFIIAWGMHNGTTPARRTIASNYQANYKGWSGEVGNLYGGTSLWSYSIGNAAANTNATCPTELSSNTWQMLSGAYDGTGGKVRCYINGTNLQNGTLSAYAESTVAIALGRSPVATTISWNGTLDEIYMFDGITGNINDIITAFYGGYGSVEGMAALPPPTMVSASILPANAYANSTLLGYCNATDANVATVRYYYQWYVNGTANASGVTGYVANATDTNVANITNGLVKNANWTLQCIANNGAYNSTALNSSDKTILNTAPDTGVPVLSPIPAFETTSAISCTNSTTSDIDGDAITFYYLWFKNGTTTGITTRNITNASFAATDVLICRIIAGDGAANSTAYNSSALTVFGSAPSLSMVAVPTVIYTQNCINATVVFYYTYSDLTYSWGNNTITLVQGGTIAAAVKHNATQNAQENFTLVLTQGNYTYGMNFTATNGSTVAGNSTPPNISFTVADSAAACMAYLINGTGTNVTVNLSEIMENATFRRAIAQDVWRYEQRYKEVYAGANEGLRWQDYALAVGIAILILFAVVEFIRHQRGPRGHFG